MEQTGQKKLFKYYLDQEIQRREQRPLFFRRTLRWRSNAKEYGYVLSKKGLLRGYLKYGALGYLGWFYLRAAFTPSTHHHGHHGGHGDSHHGSAHGNEHGHHQEKPHH